MVRQSHPLPQRRRGGVAVLVGVSLTAILLLGAVTLDGGTTLATRRIAQNAADAAALAGTIELANDQANGTTVTQANLQTAARKVAVDNGFTDDNGVTTKVTVNWPPTSGTWINNNNSVEVIITYTYNNMLIAGSNQVKTRAVATCDSSATGLGNSILAVNPTGSKAFYATAANFTMDGTSSVMVNSTDPNAAYIDGSGTVSATVHDVGGNGITTGSTFTPAVKGGYNPAPDPFALLPVPAVPSNAPAATSSGGTTTYSPGYYPNGLSISSGDAVLSPGLYYVTGGQLWINTTGSVSGSGVTFYYTAPGVADTTANTYNYGVKFCVTNNNYTFTAPTSGTYSGVSLFQDPNSAISAWVDFWGSGQLNFGAMYFPGNTFRAWSENNYGGATNPININANMLVAKNFKITGPHDWYGNQYNNGFSKVRWHPNISAAASSKPVVLVE